MDKLSRDVRCEKFIKNCYKTATTDASRCALDLLNGVSSANVSRKPREKLPPFRRICSVSDSLIDFILGQQDLAGR